MQIGAFVEILKANGIRLGAGVPCSYFTPLVNAMMCAPELDYVSAASEGEAVAIAAGMTAAGKQAFALMQNSGLGNAVNPITSLLHIYVIPVVLLVSHRGQPGLPDEPQHALMGQITEELARLCGLRTHVFDPERFVPTLRAAQAERVPIAYVVRKGALTHGPKVPAIEHGVHSQARRPKSGGSFRAELGREQALAILLPWLNRGLDEVQAAGAPAVISTTGKLSRELYELDAASGGRQNRFYMVGSMGCASGFGLGVARARPGRKVIVLDGDGALLMKLGSMATIGFTQPSNFHHVVFDNGAHESTGGQPTSSAAVDFALAAIACGYRDAETVASATALREAASRQLAMDGPTLLRVLINTGSRADLGRPKLAPVEVYARFAAFLQARSSGLRAARATVDHCPPNRKEAGSDD